MELNRRVNCAKYCISDPHALPPFSAAPLLCFILIYLATICFHGISIKSFDLLVFSKSKAYFANPMLYVEYINICSLERVKLYMTVERMIFDSVKITFLRWYSMHDVYVVREANIIALSRRMEIHEKSCWTYVRYCETNDCFWNSVLS